MAGRVIRFPLRRGAVLVLKDRNDGAWLTLCGSHVWLHGSFRDACIEAKWLARNTGLPVRVIEGAA